LNVSKIKINSEQIYIQSTLLYSVTLVHQDVDRREGISLFEWSGNEVRGCVCSRQSEQSFRRKRFSGL